jgi:hypothetical protein
LMIFLCFLCFAGFCMSRKAGMYNRNYFYEFLYVVFLVFFLMVVFFFKLQVLFVVKIKTYLLYTNLKFVIIYV